MDIGPSERGEVAEAFKRALETLRPNSADAAPERGTTEVHRAAGVSPRSQDAPPVPGPESAASAFRKPGDDEFLVRYAALVRQGDLDGADKLKVERDEELRRIRERLSVKGE